MKEETSKGEIAVDTQGRAVYTTTLQVVQVEYCLKDHQLLEGARFYVKRRGK